MSGQTTENFNICSDREQSFPTVLLDTLGYDELPLVWLQKSH